MICKNCNYDNQEVEGMKFCAKCGAPLIEYKQSKGNINEVANDKTLMIPSTDIEPLMFSEKNLNGTAVDEWQLDTREGALKAFDAAQVALNKLAPIIDKLDSLDNEMKRYGQPTNGRVFFGFFIGGGAAVLFSFFSFSVLFPIFFIGVLLIGAGVITTLSSKRRANEYYYTYYAKKEKNRKEVAEYEKMLQIEANMHPVLQFFPLELFDSYSIQQCRTALNSYRSDSFKETVNLCIEEQHRKSLEQGQMEILNSQIRMEGDINRIKTSARMVQLFSAITAYKSVFK